MPGRLGDAYWVAETSGLRRSAKVKRMLPLRPAAPAESPPFLLSFSLTQSSNRRIRSGETALLVLAVILITY